MSKILGNICLQAVEFLVYFLFNLGFSATYVSSHIYLLRSSFYVFSFCKLFFYGICDLTEHSIDRNYNSTRDGSEEFPGQKFGIRCNNC